MNMDLTELLTKARQRGFTHDFSQEARRLRRGSAGRARGMEKAWIVDSAFVDTGTDPGDDATIYLIETEHGRKGHLVVPDGFHADPDQAAFIDALSRANR